MNPTVRTSDIPILAEIRQYDGAVACAVEVSSDMTFDPPQRLMCPVCLSASA
jgi:hypothetical protein